ncbi:MAG: glycosyltransferase [Lachnospiraceae bacterium]|nr:glycosyltransferase [Lachnospiraceae bacterium]
MNGIEKDITLTISLLASNRPDTLVKCLDSLKPLMEAVSSELILIDTSKSTEISDILWKYSKQVYTFDWCNDFAKARNEGLLRAKGKWFLYLDDDEWFEDVTPIIEFFQSGEYQEYHQAAYFVRNYGNLQGTNYSEMWVSRMIRIEHDTRFEGRVHESLVPARGKCKKISAFVHHYGYVFANTEERRKHYERNISILEALIKEEPNNLRWRLQSLKEYGVVKEWLLLKQAGEAGLNLIKNLDEPFVNLCRGAFYMAVLLSEQKIGNEDVWNLYQIFIKDKRNPASVRCALATVTAIGLSNQKIESVKIIDCIQDSIQNFQLYQAEEKEEQWQIIEESTILVQDYITKQTQLEMYYLWGDTLASFMIENQNQDIEDLEWLKQSLNLLESYCPIIIQDIQKKIEGNGEFLSLPDSIWKLGQVRIIPLEDILLSLPFSQWMAQVMVLESQGYHIKWQNTETHLMQICSKEDIRYRFYDMKTEMIKMKQIYSVKTNVEKMDYTTITQVLFDFAEAILRYSDYIYTDKAFSGDMEFLPKEYKAAFWLAQAFSCKEDDWSQKLAYLGKSAKEWKILGEIVKRYAILIGEEQEASKQQAESAQNELLQMVQNIKPQIYTLVERGMIQDALAVVKQIRNIAPDDIELKEMEAIILEEIG